jgi:threonyl-tRNA synthetase
MVLGLREAEQETVAMRRLGGKDQEILALTSAVAKLKEESKFPRSEI